MVRFLHASDLHLGKPFGSFPEDVRARLRRARHEALERLLDAARSGGARHVLLAGDTFDAETPQPTTIRHALNTMAAATDIEWIVMPGNHDSLAASELWRNLGADRPPNVRLAVDAAPMALDEAILLPAPCPVRDPGEDLTAWMDGAETGDAIRIGLAHGPIHDFDPAGEAPGAAGIIAPDRARRAGLDYLALGDWHGRIEVSPGTWYSGTPEADSFKHPRRPGALLVSIEAPGAPPAVEEVATGRLGWMRLVLDLVEGEKGEERLAGILPDLADRADVMVHLTVTGRSRLSDRLALERAIARLVPDFLWLTHDLGDWDIVQDAADLDRIDRAGALRSAAESLAREAREHDDPVAREAASRALARLFSYAMDDA